MTWKRRGPTIAPLTPPLATPKAACSGEPGRGAHRPPQRHRERVVLGETGACRPAHGQPDADEGADGGEEAVPGDLQRHAIPLEERGIDVDGDAAEVWNGCVLRSRWDNNTVGLLDW